MWSLRLLIKGTRLKVVFSAALSLVLWCSYHFVACLMMYLTLSFYRLSYDVVKFNVGYDVPITYL